MSSKLVKEESTEARLCAPRQEERPQNYYLTDVQKDISSILAPFIFLGIHSPTNEKRTGSKLVSTHQIQERIDRII
ncbi:MAG: hypothetical protein ACK5YR_06270 [Pirellula sp.]